MRIFLRLLIFLGLVGNLNCQTPPKAQTSENSPDIHITYKHLQALAPLKNTVTGRTLRTENEGLTYTFPEGLVAMPEDKLPRDPTGREIFLLALWDSPRKTPVPRIVVLWDLMVRSSGSTPEIIATHTLKTLPLPKDAKASTIVKVESGKNAFWRMDYWIPNSTEQAYNTAIVVPLADRRIVLFQMNAASQHQLDLLAKSLNSLELDDNN